MGLVEHAEREMRMAGLYDADSDYAGRIPEAVMKMIRPFAEGGHSGGSAGLTLAIFERLARFKTLTPITNDPAEWQDVTAYGDPAKPMWQNNRDHAMLSTDGGKTYYSVDDEKREIKTAASK